jgi:hypothetical protein
MAIHVHFDGGGSRYRVRVGSRHLGTYRCPFFGAARTLLEEGVPRHELLIMHREGSPIVSMQGLVGEAAALTVIENDVRGPDIGRYQPPPRQRHL